jgi:beta-phosphoglucomutase-like phosphatase (HAD superfamily)
MSSPFPILQAVVFDMDGVLIDSEPFWRESEIESFGRYGLRLSEADCRKTMGFRSLEVARYWLERRPWKGPAPEMVAEEVLRGVIRRVNKRGRAMPGLANAIRVFQSFHLRLALASSSACPLIDAVIDRLEIRSCFEGIFSAEHEALGKPHPDVYLTAVAKLGLPAGACLAVEDSIAGVQAAKAAGMKCLAIPPVEFRGDPHYGIADAVLDSLLEINARIIKGLNAGP